MMVKKFLLVLFLGVLFISCKDNGGVDPDKTALELISLNLWELQRYTDATGQPISNASLNTEALLLYAMQFEFKDDGVVRGLDKTSKNIIDKGVWSFIDNENSVNVKLTGLDYDFRIVTLKTGQMTLQAPTGNFLSGVGDQINLEFTSVNQ
ncbi:hypothetical protein [Jiulongibacter sediminis]|jgi:hypothetical protein|uniref:hypothetical protein n=1 Tax=Jiulongibacter sediminis TaxID=1605367 RepID=UPI0026E9584D|nr:hypothetical protein [Jiulongibacter sediminis]